MNKETIIITMILLLSLVNVANGSTQLLPNELVGVANKHGCSQIKDFYKRPGMVKPIYVYGYMAGSEEDSAVFWCEKQINKAKKYLLVFMSKNKSDNFKCSDTIEWPNYPGGLSIYYNNDLTLKHFTYLSNSSKKPPQDVKLRHNAILSEYDGASELFYCHDGEWLVRIRH